MIISEIDICVTEKFYILTDVMVDETYEVRKGPRSSGLMSRSRIAGDERWRLTEVEGDIGDFEEK